MAAAPGWFLSCDVSDVPPGMRGHGRLWVEVPGRDADLLSDRGDWAAVALLYAASARDTSNPASGTVRGRPTQ